MSQLFLFVFTGDLCEPVRSVCFTGDMREPVRSLCVFTSYFVCDFTGGLCEPVLFVFIGDL